MPISPYSGQIYSGYATGRPYSAATSTSNYSTSATGFKIGNSTSSSALRPNASSKPSYLSGNTAALKKTFSDAGVAGLSGDSSTSFHDNSSSLRRYNGIISPYTVVGRRDLNGNNTDRGYAVSKRANLIGIKEKDKISIYDSKPYIAKFGNYYQSKEDEVKRPKEINASNININPTNSYKYNIGGDLKRGETDNLSISRNRQVVRLTIKRDKANDKIPVVLPENSVKTIAQKLFEKYTIPETKKDNTIYSRSRFVTGTKPENVVNKPPRLPLAKTSVSKDIIWRDDERHSVKKQKPDDGSDGDDELSDAESDISKDNPAKCFERATRAASTKKELEHPEEVKDAIVAAILHPDIDLESDEEIKQLMEEGSDKERSSSSSSSKKKKLKEKSHRDSKVLVRRKVSDAGSGGEMIVDKIKRYVKQQVSIKRENNHNNNNNNTNVNNISFKNNDDNNSNKSHNWRKIPINENLKSLNNENTKSNENNITIHIISDKNDTISNTNNSTNKSKKPKERIIPIILQNDSDSDNEKSSRNKSKKENKNKIKNDIIAQSFIKTNKEKDYLDISNSKTSSRLNEDRSKIRTVEESLCKSFEPVYQTTLGEASEVLPVQFQTSSRVPGELSITHPENKVPETCSPITILVSDKKKSEGKFLSQELNVDEKKGKGKEGKDTKNLIKAVKNKELVTNDYEFELSKGKKKNEDEFQSDLNNSITEDSSNLKGKEKRDNFYTKDLKLDYCVSNEETVKGCKKIKSELERQNVQKTSSQTKDRKSSIAEENNIKKEETSNSKREDIRVNSSDERHLFLAKGLPLNSEIKVSENENDKREGSKDVSKLNLEDTSKTKQNLGKSKRLFLKSLETQSKENDCKNGLLNQFNLKKSATTQVVNSDYKISIDTIEASSSNNNDSGIGIQDFEIKPSLKQFLEDSKSDMAYITETENELNKSKSSPLIPLTKDETPKKLIKKPKVLPAVEEKTIINELQNVRNILKRPIKPREEIKILNEVETLPQENKLRKVWKKPAPQKETSQSIREKEKVFDDSGKETTDVSVVNKTDLKTPSTEDIIQPASFKVNVNKQMIEAENNQNENDIDLTHKKRSQNIISKNLSNKNKKNSVNIKQENEREPNLKSNKTYSFNEDKGINDSTETIQSDISYADVEINLSTSHSADSAYGSSPSTPLPRGVTLMEENKVNNEKIDENDKNEDKKKDELIEICSMCGTNCHKKCEKQMANLCGVNQKLLAEALSSVKKGSSSDGKDSIRILQTTSTTGSKSASSVSSTEVDTTTTTEDEETETDTDSDYNGPAEIRSPIQTRPKYRKYNIEDFNFIKVLGKGSFGKVMLAQQVNTENYFAVKCLKKDVVLEDNDVECCLIERKVLTLGTKHPYLCHLFCSFQTPSHLFFVMEYLTGGDLMFHIQRSGRFDEYRACFYAAEIISGLKFLHSKGIIYRDLKLDNILLDYEGHIRIADFGMCKLQIYLDRFADTFCGTPDYMAPEVIKGLHYNQCVDWWSFGVLLYEMMIGKSPFKGCDEDHLFWLICNEEPFYPRFLSREAQSLLKMLLDKDATRRIGPPYSPNGDVKCHQFFKYVDWHKIERKEVETPYKPRLRHILDVQYFDRSFTKRNAAITPLESSILETMDQTPFKDFSYTNPNITD